ncbi:MAG: adenosylhomocysteine nucleosidase [Candidatus Latescibacterota bacterium]|jgi:adenosylhomocysteine nucleosidase
MIYLHTALAAEARPLLDHYRLRAFADEGAFRIYASPEVRLVVSGVGKTATAAAVAYTQARFADEPGPWLNIGIAGHASAALATPLLVHKAIDTANERVYYPVFSFAPPCASTCVHSVAQPTSAYEQEAAFDMEASAFIETAQRFVPAELTHSLKIVSDNAQTSWQEIKKDQVIEWIGAQLKLIDTLHQELVTLATVWDQQRAVPAHFMQSLKRWHFSASQQHRLQRLLQQWQAIAPDELPWTNHVDIHRASAALDYLEIRLGDPARAPF